MASAVDICNMALARLGDEATVTSIDPPEGSAQADHCARFYPQARDTLIMRHMWSFATRRARLARLADSVPGYSFAYALPAACVKLISVFGDGEEDADAWVNLLADKHYRIEMLGEQRVLLSDAETMNVIYLSRDIKPENFSPMFCEACSWLLAAMLAGAVIKGGTGQQLAANSMKFYEDAYQKAAAADAQQSRDPIHFVPLGLEDVAHVR